MLTVFGAYLIERWSKCGLAEGECELVEVETRGRGQRRLRMADWISLSWRRPFAVLVWVETLRQPWITVEWSRFPRRRPICLSASWASSRRRYMAKWRASVIGLARLGLGRLLGGMLKYCATPLIIASGDGGEQGLGGVSVSTAREAISIVMGERVRLA